MKTFSWVFRNLWRKKKTKQEIVFSFISPTSEAGTRKQAIKMELQKEEEAELVTIRPWSADYKCRLVALGNH